MPAFQRVRFEKKQQEADGRPRRRRFKRFLQKTGARRRAVSCKQ